MDTERLATIEQRIKDLSAELSDLEREVIQARLAQPRQLTSEERAQNEAAWHDLLDISKEVGRLWQGSADAAEEIRQQREK